MKWNLTIITKPRSGYNVDCSHNERDVCYTADFEDGKFYTDGTDAYSKSICLEAPKYWRYPIQFRIVVFNSDRDNLYIPVTNELEAFITKHNLIKCLEALNPNNRVDLEVQFYTNNNWHAFYDDKDDLEFDDFCKKHFSNHLYFQI